MTIGARGRHESTIALRHRLAEADGRVRAHVLLRPPVPKCADSWRPRAPIVIPGIARGTAGQGSHPRSESRGRGQQERHCQPQERAGEAGKADSVIGRIRLTHPDRVYWEDAGVTTRISAEFYSKIWKWMAPHLVGRQSRCCGARKAQAGQCFFQKHASAGISADRLHLVPEDGDRSCRWTISMGCCRWFKPASGSPCPRSTIEQLGCADRLVFDLDPGPGTVGRDVVAAARV